MSILVTFPAANGDAVLAACNASGANPATVTTATIVTAAPITTEICDRFGPALMAGLATLGSLQALHGVPVELLDGLPDTLRFGELGAVADLRGTGGRPSSVRQMLTASWGLITTLVVTNAASGAQLAGIELIEVLRAPSTCAAAACSRPPR